MGGTGRPPLIERSVVIEKLLQFQKEIVLPGDKILSQNDSLWQRISDELE